ncbi:hypothetical protein F4780DRAFT_439221 [Xylariomycetidae sp. FL0641]|nr:hypothetical protein F4780DRAFT_439221 [Xylariomycetidae sp. FL0641]
MTGRKQPSHRRQYPLAGGSNAVRHDDTGIPRLSQSNPTSEASLEHSSLYLGDASSRHSPGFCTVTTRSERQPPDTPGTIEQETEQVPELNYLIDEFDHLSPSPPRPSQGTKKHQQPAMALTNELDLAFPPIANPAAQGEGATMHLSDLQDGRDLEETTGRSRRSPVDDGNGEEDDFSPPEIDRDSDDSYVEESTRSKGKKRANPGAKQGPKLPSKLATRKIDERRAPERKLPAKNVRAQKAADKVGVQTKVPAKGNTRRPPRLKDAMKASVNSEKPNLTSGRDVNPSVVVPDSQPTGGQRGRTHGAPKTRVPKKAFFDSGGAGSPKKSAQGNRNGDTANTATQLLSVAPAEQSKPQLLTSEIGDHQPTRGASPTVPNKRTSRPWTQPKSKRPKVSDHLERSGEGMSSPFTKADHQSQASPVPTKRHHQSRENFPPRNRGKDIPTSSKVQDDRRSLPTSPNALTDQAGASKNSKRALQKREDVTSVYSRSDREQDDDLPSGFKTKKSPVQYSTRAKTSQKSPKLHGQTGFLENDGDDVSPSTKEVQKLGSMTTAKNTGGVGLVHEAHPGVVQPTGPTVSAQVSTGHGDYLEDEGAILHMDGDSHLASNPVEDDGTHSAANANEEDEIHIFEDDRSNSGPEPLETNEKPSADKSKSQDTLHGNRLSQAMDVEMEAPVRISDLAAQPDRKIQSEKQRAVLAELDLSQIPPGESSHGTEKAPPSNLSLARQLFPRGHETPSHDLTNSVRINELDDAGVVNINRESFLPHKASGEIRIVGPEASLVAEAHRGHTSHLHPKVLASDRHAAGTGSTQITTYDIDETPRQSNTSLQVRTAGPEFEGHASLAGKTHLNLGSAMDTPRRHAATLHPKSADFANRAAQASQGARLQARSQQGTYADRTPEQQTMGMPKRDLQAPEFAFPNGIRSQVGTHLVAKGSDVPSPQASSVVWKEAIASGYIGVADLAHMVTEDILRHIQSREVNLTHVVSEYQRNGTRLAARLNHNQIQERIGLSTEFDKEALRLGKLLESSLESATAHRKDALSDQQARNLDQWAQQSAKISRAIRKVNEELQNGQE